MDPMGNPRETTPGTPRSETPRWIHLLSPDINDNYYLSRSTDSMTPEKMT